MEPSASSSARGQEVFSRERRRRVRHKTYIPAYARLKEQKAAESADLSAVLDLSEDGLAMQASPHLQLGQNIAFDLELADSASALPMTGEVMWSDASGRAGIRFPTLTDTSVREIEQWLLRNALSASPEAVTVPSSPQVQTPTSTGEVVAVYEDFDASHRSSVNGEDYLSLPIGRDYTSLLAAIVAVQREVETKGSDAASALRLLAERAQTFTSATGAAIALLEEEGVPSGEMFCRASAGADAPRLDSRLQVGEGFSGACVRSGKLLVCMDAESDPRVDRDSTRQMGIRSMLAVPIRAQGSVVGLLEVFAPEPNAFDSQDSTILQQLAEIIPSVLRRSSEAVRRRKSGDLLTTVAAAAVLTPRPLPSANLPRSASWIARILLAAAVAILAAVVLWLLLPWVRFLTSPSTRSTGPRPVISHWAPSLTAAKASPNWNDVSAVQLLADQGDAIAQFDTGVRYATGEDYPQDYAQAAKWFLRAAEQGHVVAQAQLGAYYQQGRGVAQDPNKAYFWSLLARAGGDEGSKLRVAQLAGKLNRGQVLAVQSEANEWLKQRYTEGSSVR